MSQETYDLIIIGGGAAALSAGIYAGRAMVDTLIIEKNKIGGQATTTSEIVNYPGVKKASGPELMEEMRQQALTFGVEFANEEVQAVDFSGVIKTVTTSKQTYQAYTIILATGATPRKIGFPGETTFTGRGVAYCATCDGEFFKDLDIFVIGGGYAAAEEAIYLTRYGKSVTMVMRKPDFSCAKLTAEAAKNHPQIKIIYNTEVKEVTGEDFLNRAVFVNNQTGEETVYEAPAGNTFGVFVFAGNQPNTQLFEKDVQVDRGYIVTNERMETNLDGVYAAGDLRIKDLRQIVTAVSDGAIAATNAQKYLSDLKTEQNLPLITEKMQQRLAKVSAQPTTGKAEAQPTASAKTSPSQWFPEAMQQQLQGIFAKLTKEVTLVQFLDAENEKSAEMNAFMRELVALSPRLSLQTVQKNEAEQLAADYQVDKYPSVALLDADKQYTGVKFSGIPSGHEVNSIVLAIYNLGSEGQAVDETVRASIQQLPTRKMQIFVSLTCHYCPDVVAACQRIASLNPAIQAEMVDIGVFPELKTEKKIMSVPAIQIDEEPLIFGAKTLPEIVELLAK